MFSLFKAKPIANPPRLPNLDNSLYPLNLENQTFTTPHDLLLYALSSILSATSDDSDDANFFSEALQNNKTYQDWINFTVYGRYIQRSFSAFYRQTEDNFNADMPDLLRHELQRHTQRLPVGQTLFFGGQILPNVRHEKLLMTTLSPYQVTCIALKNIALKNRRTAQNPNQPELIINQIKVTSERVLAFAVKHNKRTSERGRHEVIVLDFAHLTLKREDIISVACDEHNRGDKNALIRQYEIG